jgi:hypothetical protein
MASDPVKGQVMMRTYRQDVPPSLMEVVER